MVICLYARLHTWHADNSIVSVLIKMVLVYEMKVVSLRIPRVHSYKCTHL